MQRIKKTNIDEEKVDEILRNEIIWNGMENYEL